MKKVRKVKKQTKNDLKFCFLSDLIIKIGNNTFEANKKHCVDEILANSLKNTNSYKKWHIKFI